MATLIKTLLERKTVNKVFAMPPSSTVFDALVMMNENRIGSVLIMEGEKLLGIFSERDYARKGIIQGRKAKSTSITELMTSNVFTVEEKFTTKECLDIMGEKRIRHLPVIRDSKVIGLLSVGDIVNALIQEQGQTIDYLENYIRS